jgi:hypothetical protein
MRLPISVTLLALCLTGCGARPSATLASFPLEAPLAATYASTLDRVKVLDEPRQGPSVSLAKGTTLPLPAEAAQTPGAASAGTPNVADDSRANDAPDVVMPGEERDTAANKPLDGTLQDDPTKSTGEVADKNAASVDHTDSAGRAYAASSSSFAFNDPVYLTPNYYPIMSQGGPVALPNYTPHATAPTNWPTDAVAELSRLGRLRERKAHFMKWLFGYGFPKIEAVTARTMLSNGQVVYLAPDASRIHFARTYQAQASTAALDALLPILQQDAMTAAGQAAREADIAERANVLPAFNTTYDIYKLLYLEAVADGYSYYGQPVHRGLVTAANLYALPSVRRAIATYWEDHPRCTAAEFRSATNRALADKFRTIASSAGSLAEMPSVYADARIIPGLREPRAIVQNDRYAHDEDVRYNLQVIRTIAYNTPLMLSSALYN